MQKVVKIIGLLALMLTMCFAIGAYAADVCYVGDNAENTYASLDEAIRAAAGNTVHLLSNAEWNPTSVDYANAKATIDGGNHTVSMKKNIYANGGTEFTFVNVTVDMEAHRMAANSGGTINLGNGAVLKNGTTANGGAITVAAGANATMTAGSRIENCTATNGGGAYLVQGTLEITGGTITGCKAKVTGGAIRVQDNGTLKLSGNPTITGNTLDSGAENNIAMAVGSSNLVLSGTFTGSAGITYGTNNIGTQFGTTESYVSGADKLYSDLNKAIGGSEAAGKLVFANNGVCYVGDSQANAYLDLDAAIRAAAGRTVHLLSNAEWNPTSVDYANAKATIDGGNYTVSMKKNIYANGGTEFTFTNVTIDMEAHRMAANAGGTINLENGALLKNGTTVNGGAITVAAGANATMAAGSRIENCTATNGGGAYLVQGTLEITGGTITGCKAKVTGGAIRVQDNGTLRLSGNPTITGNTLDSGAENNIAMAVGSSNLVLSGTFTGIAGITYGTNDIGTQFGTTESYVSGADKLYSDLNKVIGGSETAGKLVFVNNGVCYVGDSQANAYLDLDTAIRAAAGRTVHVIKATDWNPESNSYLNAKAIIDGGDLTVSIKKNIYANTGSSFEFKNVTLDISGYHMVANSGGEIKLSDGAILENGASSTGAAISVAVGGLAVMNDGSVISDCVATANGGAVLVGGTFTMNGGEILRCSATNMGGAIWIQGGTFNFVDGTIKNCSAANGGAILISDNGTLNITDGIVTENSLTDANGNGGAIFAGAGSTIAIDGNADITGNFRFDDVNNIFLNADEKIIKLNADFDGNIGIYRLGNNEGIVFGEVANGVTIKNISSVTGDGNDAIVCAIDDDGSMAFVKKPDLSASTDTGVYTESETDKGIIRYLTEFAKGNDKVTSYGTYVLDLSIFEDGENQMTATNTFMKNSMASQDTEGKGYIVDVYTKNLNKAYQGISFIYIQGIDEPIFKLFEPVTIGLSEAKSLDNATIDEYNSQYSSSDFTE